MNWGPVAWKRRDINDVSLFPWTQSVGWFFPSPNEASINKSSSISEIQMSTSAHLLKSKGWLRERLLPVLISFPPPGRSASLSPSLFCSSWVPRRAEPWVPTAVTCSLMCPVLASFPSCFTPFLLRQRWLGSSPKSTACTHVRVPGAASGRTPPKTVPCAPWTFTVPAKPASWQILGYQDLSSYWNYCHLCWPQVPAGNRERCSTNPRLHRSPTLGTWLLCSFVTFSFCGWNPHPAQMWVAEGFFKECMMTPIFFVCFPTK